MCRLFMSNSDFVLNVGPEWLAHLFTELEKKLGGSGNGIAISYAKDKPEIIKGLDCDTVELANTVYERACERQDMDYVVFHTRLATSGYTCNEMCHPFSNSDERAFMAHNGVIPELAHSRNGFSDSKIAFDLMSYYGWDYRDLDQWNGVFVGVNKRRPYVVKRDAWTDLQLLANEDFTSWAFCSAFYGSQWKKEVKTYNLYDIPKCNWSKVFREDEVKKWKQYTRSQSKWSNNDETYYWQTGTSTNYPTRHATQKLVYDHDTGDTIVHKLGCFNHACRGECIPATKEQ